LLVAALIGLGMAGQSFLPDFNEGTLTVGVETIPGTALAESAKLGQMVEEVLLTHPEVVATARRTGRYGPTSPSWPGCRSSSGNRSRIASTTCCRARAPTSR
jgi:Cu/Ag efflux pump CusA